LLSCDDQTVPAKNPSGVFVSPSPQCLSAAVSNNWENSGFSEILTGVRGHGAWPITGATVGLVRKVQDKPEQAREVLKFFAWAFKEGDRSVTESNCVTLTDSTTCAVSTLWQVVRDSTRKPIFDR
jgi:phosphate transport system substrate-binding protein